MTVPCLSKRAGFNCSATWMGPITDRQVPVNCTSQAITNTGYMSPVMQLSNINDRDKLRTIKSAWGSPSFLASWDKYDMPCGSPGWLFVECNWEGRVSKLNFSSMGLVGTLPADLAQLSALEVLDLSYNGISGPLPDFYSSGRLRVLDFSHNQLSGTLPPSWRYLASLQSLDLSYNLFQVRSGWASGSVTARPLLAVDVACRVVRS